MNLNSAIARAKKLIAEKERALSTNNNQLIVATEFNQELSGELVIILYKE